MLQELIYTSAPVGLKPGNQGFCTVACTTGTPQNVVKLLETLSGYRHVFVPSDTNVGKNPVACSHLLLSLGGVPWHILSRTTDAGLDYSQQKNSISHHIVLDKAELQNAGPAAVLSHYPFLSSWNQKPVIFPAGKKLPAFSSQPRVCEQWAKLAGDAGWGGILAETALTRRPVSIIFRPGMTMLPLMDEALALLPPEVRWQVSFSTYFCNLPNGTGCQWKCILSGSPEMSSAKPTANTLVIDLTQTLGTPPTGQFVEAARTGTLPEPVVRPENRRQEITIIPLAIRESEQTVYGTKTADTPPLDTTPVNVSSSQTPQTPVKPKSAKNKKVGNDDVAAKGCFWLIILFFILVTAGLIGGIVWYFGKDITQQGNASSLEKTVSKQKQEIEDLQNQLAVQKTRQETLDNEIATWQKTKNEYDQLLNARDKYINDVAGYFSLFPPVSLPPVSVNVKDGIPRKDGDQEPMNVLLGFNGILDRTWNIGDMLSVRVSCSDDKMDCQFTGTIKTYSSGNVLLGYPFRLFAQQEDNSYVPVADFDLVVTESGISVCGWNDDAWNKLVEEELKKIHDAKKQDPFGISGGMIEWYEANVQDKPFVLDEDMLTRMDELDANAMTPDVVRLLELRKDYYKGRIPLQFVFDLKLNTLTDKVKRYKP